MNELFLGALDLSPYYREFSCNNGYFHLYMRDVPDCLYQELKLLTIYRLRLPFYFNCSTPHRTHYGEQPVQLYRIAIMALSSIEAGRMLFERSKFPNLPDCVLEGAFSDCIPF